MIERGQIYWCGLDPVIGHEQGAVRPVVVVSSNAYNRTQSPLVAIIPLTKSLAKNPLHLTLSSVDTGLDSDSTLLTDRTRFIDRRRLRGAPVGKLQAEALAALNRNLSRILEL